MPVLLGQQMVAKDLILCNGDKKAMAPIARVYINRLIRLFRQNKGETPKSSYHPSRPSFNDNSAFFRTTVDPAPRDHRAAKRAALERDSYRCMVTGLLDDLKYDELSPVEQAASGPVVATEFCHIFPPSTSWNLKMDEANHPKTNYAGHVWNLVSSFGGIQVLDELKSNNIHRLSNGLTLATHVHKNFDRLDLWFEEVSNGPANTYLVRCMRPLMGVPTTPITFTSSSLDLELPNPKYLRLHAAVCRVAHMSGAAEYLDKHDRDFESMAVLANDGSSGEVLASRLQGLLLAS